MFYNAQTIDLDVKTTKLFEKIYLQGRNLGLIQKEK